MSGIEINKGIQFGRPCIIGWVQGLRDAGIARITLLCHCGEGKFCHTHLAIDFLCKHYAGDFEDVREVKPA